jgi:uncharacterized protein (TIGR02996 family)
MSDQEGLLRAILEDPEDDTVRLAYADWLDEHDQPERAEFIRIQITLSKDIPCDHCGGKGYTGYQSYTATCSHCRSAFLALKAREYTLWQAHFPTQLDWDLPICGKYAWQVSPRAETLSVTPVAILRRGFVDEIRVRASQLFNDHETVKSLFTTHPIRAVVLTDRIPDAMFNSKVRLWHRMFIMRNLEDAPSMIPAMVWDALPPSLPSEYPEDEWVGKDEETARAALAAATLSVCRAIAKW